MRSSRENVWLEKRRKLGVEPRVSPTPKRPLTVNWNQATIEVREIIKIATESQKKIYLGGGDNTLSNAACKSRKMRTKSWALDSAAQKSLMILMGEVSVGWWGQNLSWSEFKREWYKRN